jgi:CelD/BcsL family acetyltransferase involved in cellulose biosynthesis
MSMTLISPAPPTTAETLTTLDAFEALAAEWDPLVRAMPRPSPFLLHGWLAEWWRHFGTNERCAVHVVRRDGRLVAALPVAVARRAGARVARFMGGPEAVLPDLLVGAGADEHVAALLIGRLDESCDVAELHGLPPGSRIAAALGTRMSAIERIEAPVLDLAAGWEAVYRSKTNSKKRNLHKRRRRQLGELGDLTTEVAREPEELAAALEDAFRLHALRWEGRPDGSGFATETGRRFQRAALRRLCEIDVPRIATTKLDGRAIAFHYWFALEGRMYVHRLAFDPALARFSPGLVNTLDAIAAAAGEGLTRVEFLGGGERYKLELADAPEPLMDGFAVASGIVGHTYAATQMAAIRTRLRLKRSERLRRLYFDDVAPARRALRAATDRVSAARGGR